MGRAEFGTPKYVANQMKSRGLQRLRWYCQACEKQCRDENGFKCHVSSESHVRKMLVLNENSKSHLDEYSEKFKSDFLSLLRTSHGEKTIKANRFYQEYISNKSHIHMNATKWRTLSEFIKYLGREGYCRVAAVDDSEENNDSNGNDKSSSSDIFTISWIDNSPEALKRAEAIRKKERAEKGDEKREMKELDRQIKKAFKGSKEHEKKEENHSLPREESKVQSENGNKPMVFGISLKIDKPKATNSLKSNPFKRKASSGISKPKKI